MRLLHLSCVCRYLYEFLYGWLVSALTRADSFLIEQEVSADGHRGRSAKKNRAKKRKTRPYGKEITMYQALQNLCGGFYKVNITCANALVFFLYNLVHYYTVISAACSCAPILGRCVTDIYHISLNFKLLVMDVICFMDSAVLHIIDSY
jgi:hypothetical protein